MPDYQKIGSLIPFLGLSDKEGLQIQGNVIDQKAGGSEFFQQSLTSSVAEEPLTLTPRRLGIHTVPESSGVVASRQYPGVYWMHGDSGQAASIIAVNASGATIKVFSVLGSSNIDWEDIALDENNNIWISDTGDNAQARADYILYKVAEPDPFGAATTVTAAAHRFVYPDGAKDSEATFIWGGIPYIVQKRPTNARVYAFPEINSSITVTLIFIGEFNNTNNWITGADISRDGRRLALINDGVDPDYHWIIERNSSSTTIADFFNAPSRQWRIQFNNNQGEAIGFVNGKYDFVVASETGDFWGIDRSQYDPSPPDFIFAAGGDHGSNGNTNASLDVLNQSGASFYLALGDMSYGVVGQESIWCDQVKSRLNTAYPFELVSGNHEEDGGPNGRILSFAGCLPDRLSASGIYGAEYFFDYLNLTRIIMISPALTVGGVSYTYTLGNSHYTWLSNAIDTARAQGIPWVIVAMHKNCITAATKSCEIGADLLNLLLNKKVDLILQGHDHVYERSKQITCATSGSYLSSCVADDGSDGIYTRGAGSVLVITGVFGQSLYAINTGDSEAGYFAKWMGSNINPTYGFTRFFVNQSEISVDFLRSIGGTFTDSFRIVNASSVTSPLRLQAFHRNGQTFLTWDEAGNYFIEDLNFSQYDNIRNANPGIRYRIYRYTAPITSSNLNLATRIAEVGVGTGYNFYLYGKESSDSWGSRAGLDIPRFVIQEGIGGWGLGELPLNMGLYVHTTAEPLGNFYYATTLVNNSLENRTDFSSLSIPVSETYDSNWKPILQNKSFVNETWYSGSPSARTYYYSGDQHFFTRWEAPQLTDLASRPNNYRVVIPSNVAPPYKIDMNLHCWGSSLVSCNRLVFYPDGIYLTSTDYPPQSWWAGWNENLSFTSSQNQWNGINRYYTMHRMISFIDWMKTQWSIDNNRIMCSGWSMGGSGGKMFCLRYGNYFNYINSWAGVGVAKNSPLFNESFIGLFGSISRGILDENGINTWNDINMSYWLRANPLQETPFISFSNAKNDGGIGWEQAVEFYQALRDTKRPFTFRWSQEGHENHALDMSLIELSDYAGANRIDFQKNKALPAFTRFSLDNNPGNGDPLDGDSVGYVNAYQKWNTNTIVDQPGNFEIELWLNQSPNLTGTTDVTLRNLQSFSVSPGQSFSWVLMEGATLVQQGSGFSDSLGLVTVNNVILRNNTKRKLIVDKSSSFCPTLSAPAGNIIIVNSSQASQLDEIVAGAASGTTVLLQDGTYNLNSNLIFAIPRVALRSQSGNRDAVILDGGYTIGEPVYISAANITIADLTIQRAFYHPIHVVGGGHQALLYNLHILDARQQLVKVNSDGNGYADFGTLACSLVEFTAAGRQQIDTVLTGCYTNGFDALQSWGWTIRDNVFKEIHCDGRGGNLSGPTILFWRSSRDPLIERNILINSSQGIVLGLMISGGERIYPDDPLQGTGLTPSQVGHIGGVVKNNIIYIASGVPHDAYDGGIAVKQAINVSVYHNTIYTEGTTAFDFQFANTQVITKNNLYYPTNVTRDNAVPIWANNTLATSGMFVNLLAGDLHLLSTATAAINQGATVGVAQDIDGDARDAQPDVGADEYTGSGIDTTPPTIPGGLAALAVNSSQINLAWNSSSDPESGILRYNVWRDTVLVRQPVTASVADSSLSPSTTYSYEVSAVNGVNLESARSGAVLATTLAAPDTTAPTVSITSLTQGQVVNGTLTVNATASDTVGVAGVRFFVDGIQLNTEDSTAPYSRTWNTSTASNGLHVVMATARDAAGNTASANVTVSVSNSVPVDTTSPTVPTNLAVTVNTSYQVNLTWNPSIDAESGVANYRVYRNSVLIGQPTGTFFSDLTVISGTTYLYSVAAVNFVGLVSGNSSALSVTTPALPPPTLAITSPIQNGVVTTRDVVVMYAESGNLSLVNHTHLQLDSQEVMDLDNDGSYTFLNVGDGSHILSVWMVRENHTLIGNSTSVTFSVAVPVTPPPDGGGGGNNGGGGGGGTPQGPKTLKLTYPQLQEGVKAELLKGDGVQAAYANGIIYLFTVESVSSTSVVVKQGTASRTLLLNTGEEFNLNGDNVNELLIRYTAYQGGKATLYFKELQAPIAPEEISSEEETPEEQPAGNLGGQVAENISRNKSIIISVFVVLILLFGGVVWLVWWYQKRSVSKIADEFREQFEKN